MKTLTDYVKIKNTLNENNSSASLYDIFLPNLNLKIHVYHCKNFLLKKGYNIHTEEETLICHIKSDTLSIKSDIVLKTSLSKDIRAERITQAFIKAKPNMDKIIKFAIACDYIVNNPNPQMPSDKLQDNLTKTLTSFLYHDSITKKLHDLSILQYSMFDPSYIRYEGYEHMPTPNLKNLFNEYCARKVNPKVLIKETLVALKKQNIQASQDEEKDI